MPSVRVLTLALLSASAIAVLFAFTLIGLVSEAVALLALAGLLVRMACALSAAVRHSPHC